jgi:cation diffusion facilitator family transporter
MTRPVPAGEDRAKQRAATVSLAFNIVSTVVKFVAALATGSVGLLSEAIHSASDVFSSSIAFLSVRAAAAPPDDEHPFGHGKIESLAGFGEAILLFLIVIYILFEAISKLIIGPEVARLDIGIVVMTLSSIGALVTSRYVRGVGKRTHSLALISNSQHLFVDFVTSVGLLVALVAVGLTGWHVLDPIIGIVLAAWIAFGAWRLSVQAFHELIDQRLPEEELQRIRDTLEADSRVLSYHRLRTRRSGSMRNIDLHVVVPNAMTLVEAHQLADDLEKRIEHELSPAHCVIHVDPFDATKAGRHEQKTPPPR